MVTISLIAAMASNCVIGNDNDLPWKGLLPKEMAYFKEKTLGKPVILGRKTFQSFGERPLPKRPHIILTRDKTYTVPKGVHIAYSMEEAVKISTEIALSLNSDEVMVLGGAEIYKQALEYACGKYKTRIYLTEIQKEMEGETKFPDFSQYNFTQLPNKKRQSENGIDYDFVIYEKS